MQKTEMKICIGEACFVRLTRARWQFSSLLCYGKCAAINYGPQSRRLDETNNESLHFVGLTSTPTSSWMCYVLCYAVGTCFSVTTVSTVLTWPLQHLRQAIEYKIYAEIHRLEKYIFLKKNFRSWNLPLANFAAIDHQTELQTNNRQHSESNESREKKCRWHFADGFVQWMDDDWWHRIELTVAKYHKRRWRMTQTVLFVYRQ